MALAAINWLQAILIALVLGLMTPSAAALPAAALAAVIVHLLVDMFAPVVTQNAEPAAPALAQPEFWIVAAALFIGYFLIIGVIVLLRAAVDKS